MTTPAKLLVISLVIANLVVFGSLGLILWQHFNAPSVSQNSIPLASGQAESLRSVELALVPGATAKGKDTATSEPSPATNSGQARTPTFTPMRNSTFTPTRTRTSTATFTRTSTRPPATNTPLALATNTPRPPPTALPKPPAVTEFDPPLANWPNVYFEPVQVAPGQPYWHLAKAIYCDAYSENDPRLRYFGCDQLPGGNAGTTIYVMTGGADIDAIRGGVNYGDRPDVIGDKKSPGDMCQCTFAIFVSDYRLSVRGLPSDGIGGFCLCSRNGSNIPDGHAHVRYFLYFAIATR